MNGGKLMELARALGLKKARITGGNLVASCPFAPYRHIKEDGTRGKDSRASFGVKVSDTGESVYNCFGCASKGDLLWLCSELGELRGRDYTELEEFIWKEEGVEALRTVFLVEPMGPGEKVKHELQQRAIDVYPETDYDQFRGCVPRYALERGLSIEACKAWDLGHDPGEGRLMFPIRRFTDRKLVGLKGRSYTGAQSKYFPYLPFNQGHYFFGEHMVRDDPTDQRIVIVEGEIDAIKVWMAGWDCLALMGGFMSREQKRKLEVLERPVILCPDKDAKGEAWCRSAGDYLKNILGVYDVVLPEDAKDAGAMLPEKIDALLKASKIRV